jgi:hypothetical protein
MIAGNESSLYATVMSAAERVISGNPFSHVERTDLVRWILSHQNYGGGFLFALDPAERQSRVALLTGEKPRTFLLTENAFECETLRLLALFAPDDPEAMRAIALADQRLSKQCFAQVCLTGECPHVSIAYLRFQASQAGRDHEMRVFHGLEVLSQHRARNSGWVKFPFWYTSLWLSELPAGLVQEELAFIAPTLKRAQHDGFTGPGSTVRTNIVQRILGSIQARG